MTKRIYKSVKVNEVFAAELIEAAEGRRVAFGIDVAKETCFAQAMVPSEDGPLRLMRPMSFKQSETAEFVGLLSQLGDSTAAVEVALEPTGTYGDALCYQLQHAGIAVYQVSPKRCHDAAEVFDGVPSMHDPKAADVLARLHLHKASQPWEPKTDAARALSVATKLVAMFDERDQRLQGQIEALLARHWPELTDLLALKSMTLVSLLECYGSAQAVDAAPADAKALMRTASHGRLSWDKIEAVLHCASNTRGVPPIEAERQWVIHLATEAKQARNQAKLARAELTALTASNEAVQRLAPVVGQTTAAVLVDAVGDPRDYGSARQLVKAMGLNLKVRSSGKQAGQLKITKRGPPRTRRYLYMAAMRLLQNDAIVGAWYQRKVARDGGRHRRRAVVAVMRKLVKALFHVARGEVFDSSRLFDTTKLQCALRAA